MFTESPGEITGPTSQLQSTKPKVTQCSTTNPHPVKPGTTRSQQENIPNTNGQTTTTNLKPSQSRNFTIRPFTKALEERESRWERRGQTDSDPDHAAVQSSTLYHNPDLKNQTSSHMLVDKDLQHPGVNETRNDPRSINDSNTEDLTRLEDLNTSSNVQEDPNMRPNLELAPDPNRTQDLKSTDDLTAKDLSMELKIRDPAMLLDLEPRPDPDHKEITTTHLRKMDHHLREDPDALDALEAELVSDLDRLREGQLDQYAEDPGRSGGFGRASPTWMDHLSIHEEPGDLNVMEVKDSGGTAEILAGVYARTSSPKPKTKESGVAIPTIVIVPATPDEPQLESEWRF